MSADARVIALRDQNGAGEIVEARPNLCAESWREFSARAGERVPCLVEGLWPRGALGFVSAPPKAGKTWLGLSLGLSVSTGRSLFGRFGIPEPRPVLYVALEGHRAALRARVGALARGLGLNPDGADLDRLYWTYKPRGMNLASAEWAVALEDLASELDSALVVVDVLRRAAAFKENEASDFLLLCGYLAPLLEAGRSVALLHHFGKLSEVQKDRAPAERMAGSGAMFGALDVGLFITGSEDHARRLRIHVESRDLAAPDPFGLELTGIGSGPNGGFLYEDACRIIEAKPPGEAELKAPAADIDAYIRGRGGSATPKEILEHFDIRESTLRVRRDALEKLGIGHERGLYFVNSDQFASAETADRGSRVNSAQPCGIQIASAETAIEAERLGKDPELQGFRQTANPRSLKGGTSLAAGSSAQDEIERLAARAREAQDDVA